MLSIVIAATASAAPPEGCEVPKQIDKKQTLPCVQSSGMMLDQPTLTPAQLANGPGFDAAHPEQSRFLYFIETDDVRGYFRPHYAFKKIKGESLKFQLWLMKPDGAFQNKKGEPIQVDEVKVVVKPGDGGEKRASLYPRDDDKNEHEIKADRVKVKYLKPPLPEPQHPLQRSLYRSCGQPNHVAAGIPRRSCVPGRLGSLHRLLGRPLRLQSIRQ